MYEFDVFFIAFGLRVPVLFSHCDFKRVEGACGASLFRKMLTWSKARANCLPIVHVSQRKFSKVYVHRSVIVRFRFSFIEERRLSLASGKKY